MPKWLESLSADLVVRRVFRASHVFYFDADDGLADLARSLPKLKLVGADRRGVRFGDFHRLVLPLMQLAEGDDVGFPSRKYGKDTLDDVLALDPAWKMAVHLMRADEWGACAIGTLVDRLKTAKGRATPAQLCMFTVTREDQFYEVPQDADPAQRMLLWMGEAGYTPEELFMDGGCDIAAIVDYYAETRFGLKYVDDNDVNKGHESDPRSFNGGSLADGSFSKIRTYTNVVTMALGGDQQYVTLSVLAQRLAMLRRCLRGDWPARLSLYVGGNAAREVDGFDALEHAAANGQGAVGEACFLARAAELLEFKDDKLECIRNILHDCPERETEGGLRQLMVAYHKFIAAATDNSAPRVTLTNVLKLDALLRPNLQLWISKEVRDDKDWSERILFVGQHVSGGTGVAPALGDATATNQNRPKAPKGNCVANLDVKHSAEIKGSRDYIDTKRAALELLDSKKPHAALECLLGGYWPEASAGGAARPPKYVRVAVFAMILWGEGEVGSFDPELRPLERLRAHIAGWLGSKVLQLLGAPEDVRLLSLDSLYKSFTTKGVAKWEDSPPDFENDAWRPALKAMHGPDDAFTAQKGVLLGGSEYELRSTRQIACVLLRDALGFVDSDGTGLSSPADMWDAVIAMWASYGVVPNMRAEVTTVCHALYAGVFKENGRVLHAARTSSDGAALGNTLIVEPSQALHEFNADLSDQQELCATRRADNLKGRSRAAENADLKLENERLLKETERLSARRKLTLLPDVVEATERARLKREAAAKLTAGKQRGPAKLVNNGTELVYGQGETRETWDVTAARAKLEELGHDTKEVCVTHSLLLGRHKDDRAASCMHAADDKMHRENIKDFHPSDFRTDARHKRRVEQYGGRETRKSGTPRGDRIKSPARKRTDGG